MNPIILAARPKTLTAALIPVIVGTSLAAHFVFIDWLLLTSSIACALCLQMATNFINDALDFKKGADNEERLGPLRVTASGLLTEGQVLFCGFTLLLFATCLAIPLLVKGGIPIALLLSASLLLAYGYTGGPYPLAYKGLGEVFVLLFFGFVATCGSAYIQMMMFTPSMFLASLQMGLLATLLIAINNLRDIDGDTKSGKKTLAVRYGKAFAKKEILYLTMTPFILSFGWILLDYPGAAIFPWMTLPIALKIVRSVGKEEPSCRYNKFLGQAALLHLCFGLTLASGFHAI